MKIGSGGTARTSLALRSSASHKKTYPQNCNCSETPQMRGIGLRAIAALCEQAYDKADVVLPDSYLFYNFSQE